MISISLVTGNRYEGLLLLHWLSPRSFKELSLFTACDVSLRDEDDDDEDVEDDFANDTMVCRSPLEMTLSFRFSIPSNQ